MNESWERSGSNIRLTFLCPSVMSYSACGHFQSSPPGGRRPIIGTWDEMAIEVLNFSTPEVRT